jgi:hypothetical protein
MVGGGGTKKWFVMRFRLTRMGKVNVATKDPILKKMESSS